MADFSLSVVGVPHGSRCRHDVCPRAAFFFPDKERGWFWREIQPEPKQLTGWLEKPSMPHPPRIQDSPKFSPPEPLPSSAAWFRKDLERYRDRAVDDPSSDNVAAYYYLQRVVMDKAHRFTDVARQVVMSDPFLDENQRRPIATFAANESNRLAGVATEQALLSVAHHAGIRSAACVDGQLPRLNFYPSYAV